MSALTNQTSATAGDYLFIQNSQNIIIPSSISLFDGTLNISQINLDAIQMDCGYVGPTSTPTLFLNNNPVASTSSFTSSIVSWSQYAAIAPITYSAGGGVLNFSNVNALSNVSSATMNSGTISANAYTGSSITVSSINGAPYPSPTVPNLIGATTTAVTGLNTITIDMSSLSTGWYVISVGMASNTAAEALDCSAIIRVSGGFSTGGSYHQPVINGVSNSNNYVSIQQNTVQNAITNVYLNLQAEFAGLSIQTGVYRLY